MLADPPSWASASIPERLNAILRHYFAAMSEILEAWGGRVEKYIGDAIMAVFGLPITHEDDPERAVRASLAMRARLTRLNDELDRQHGVRLSTRIAIHLGEVIVPADGPGPMVAGDAVNTAARLEQAAAPGEIMAGDGIARATRGLFALDGPLSIAAKGKAEAVQAWRVVSAAPPATGGRPFVERAPLVGRDRELEGLRADVLATPGANQAQMVLVTGEPGVGKSRLVRELVTTSAALVPALLIHRGRCQAGGQRRAFGALTEILLDACGVSLDDAIREPERRVRAAVAGLIGPADADRVADALAVSAGIATPANPLLSAEPREVALEVDRAWPRFISGPGGARARTARRRDPPLGLRRAHGSARPPARRSPARCCSSARRVPTWTQRRPR